MTVMMVVFQLWRRAISHHFLLNFLHSRRFVGGLVWSTVHCVYTTSRNFETIKKFQSIYLPLYVQASLSYLRTTACFEIVNWDISSSYSTSRKDQHPIPQWCSNLQVFFSLVSIITSISTVEPGTERWSPLAAQSGLWCHLLWSVRACSVPFIILQLTEPGLGSQGFKDCKVKVSVVSEVLIRMGYMDWNFI
jgi:hypothetical protein